MIKQRQELVELYEKGGRADLVRQEQEEIAIISAYLPKQMSEAEMKAAIEAAVKETGAAGMKDMGKVIGVLRGKYAGQMDMAGQRDGEGAAWRVSVTACPRRATPYAASSFEPRFRAGRRIFGYSAAFIPARWKIGGQRSISSCRNLANSSGVVPRAPGRFSPALADPSGASAHR